MLAYHFGTVTLTFHPGNAVRWSSWGLVISAMPSLFTNFEFTGFDFCVLSYNAPVAIGTLSWRA